MLIALTIIATTNTKAAPMKKNIPPDTIKYKHKNEKYILSTNNN
jgi:hypothetical protein